MLPPPYPPACELKPGDALTLGAWVTLSAFVGLLGAHGVVNLLRGAHAVAAAFRARRIEKLHSNGGKA
jgi:hypothetical protein